MAQLFEAELNSLVITAIITIFFPTVYSIIKLFESSAKSNTPPGPRPWPILGNIPHMMSSSPLVNLLNLSKTYGPLIYLRLGTQPLILTSSRESVREIFTSKDRNFTGSHPPSCVPFPQSQLDQTSFGWADDRSDYWRLVRTLLRTELFSSKAIHSQGELREKSISEMLRLLRSAKENRTLKISEIVFGTVFNIIGNAVMSRDLIRLDEEEKNKDGGLKDLSREVIQILSSPNLSDFYPIFRRFDVQGLRKRLSTAYSRLRGVWEPIVAERKIARANDHSYKCRDFLDVLLENGFTNDQITLLFTDLFVAGSDTTTSAIEWTLAELLKNPELMTKVCEEIEGEIKQDFPRNSHLLNLPYLQACVKETLRLHPPTPLLLPRRAIKTCQVMNYTIPKDTQLLVNVWAIGHDPDSWVEPLQYNPERFLTLNPGFEFKGSDFEFLPFGAGRRICPGMPMATKNVPLILAALIHFFDWMIPQETEINLSEKFGVTIEMEHPLTLIPKSRR